ncbi:hypothetical protein HDU85_002019 [Gaertneriomyces sp. JEL0708]|nr:hypothetical protein HDU85_002019 [Gaertneriomyces sp. JEL0708]
MTAPAKNIIVHHLNSSRSQRILWLLEELNLPYEVKKYQRGPDMRAPKELEQIHPLGKSPVVTDGDITLAESGAIIEYLVDTYGNGRLKPSAEDAQALRDYRYWLHFAEGSAMPPLLLTLVFSKVRSSSPFIVRPVASGISKAVHSQLIDPDVHRIFSFIESHLSKNEWFAGKDFTAADVQMSFPLEAALSRIADVIGENTKKFVEKIQAREAYKKASVHAD